MTTENQNNSEQPPISPSQPSVQANYQPNYPPSSMPGQYPPPAQGQPNYYQPQQPYPYQQPPMYYPPQPQRKKGLPTWAIVLLVIFGIAIIGGGISAAQKSNSSSATTVTKSADAATAATSNNANANNAAAPAQTSSSTAAIGKPGDTMTGGGYVITVHSVETAKGFQQYFEAKPGNKMIALDITIESSKDKGVSVNSFYTTLKDSKGYKYNFTAFGKDPSLGSQNDLPKGDKIRGWVTFEVPESATGFVFEYKPILDNIIFRFSLN